MKLFKNPFKKSKEIKYSKISIWEIIPENVYQMTKTKDKNGIAWNLDAKDENNNSIFLGTIYEKMYENVYFPVGSFDIKPKEKLLKKN